MISFVVHAVEGRAECSDRREELFPLLVGKVCHRGRHPLATAELQLADLGGAGVSQPQRHHPAILRLVLALDQSVHGGPQTRMIIGEAGVGKSTLVRQLLPESRLRGAVMVTGGSWPDRVPQSEFFRKLRYGWTRWQRSV